MSATPVPAATILMLRDAPEAGLETLMVVRHHQIDFASGALVFPGGKVEFADTQVRDYCRVDDPLGDESLSLMVGAIREAFEESGILLAYPKGDNRLISGTRLGTLDQFRKPLNKGELSLADFLEQEELLLACDQLQHFAHWITPRMMPKRFDTHFYLAAPPADHLATQDGYETVDSVWLSPQEALSGAEAGTYTLIFPTQVNVELLGRSQSVAEALRMAAQRPSTTVIPWTEERPDGLYICIPPEAGYSRSEARIGNSKPEVVKAIMRPQADASP